MASSTTYENTVGGSTKLLYNDTSANDYVVELPKSNGKLISGNTTAYNNDTSTFIANTLASGAIIERGSNANGEYVKYADGTLICWHTPTTIYSTTASIGAIYYVSITVTFPATFAVAPSVTASAIKSGGTGVSWAGGQGATTTYTGLWGVATHADHTLLIRYIAIGRWKS